MITRTTGVKNRPSGRSVIFPEPAHRDARPTTTSNTLMREAEICLNKCQIPRLHIVCQRSFEPPQKNAPAVSNDMPATNGLERRLNQTNNLYDRRNGHRATEPQSRKRKETLRTEVIDAYQKQNK